MIIIWVFCSKLFFYCKRWTLDTRIQVKHLKLMYISGICIITSENLPFTINSGIYRFWEWRQSRAIEVAAYNKKKHKKTTCRGFKGSVNSKWMFPLLKVSRNRNKYLRPTFEKNKNNPIQAKVTEEKYFSIFQINYRWNHD